MGITITGTHLGNKKVEITHQQSGSKIVTDAPLDNNGDGTLFSPTDLLAAGLASCIVTVIAIYAENRKIDVSKMTFSCEKIMSQRPRRIGAIPITIHLPGALTSDIREQLENAGMMCPAKQSLHPDIEIDINYIYDL
ncbi:MAG: OsmC family protein [Deltaproteobacteria bacterium]|nr:OsmC family protein [Deltaproteobacteria bacterium]